MVTPTAERTSRVETLRTMSRSMSTASRADRTTATTMETPRRNGAPGIHWAAKAVPARAGDAGEDNTNER